MCGRTEMRMSGHVLVYRTPAFLIFAIVAELLRFVVTVSELLFQVVASFVSLCKLGTCWVSACQIIGARFRCCDGPFCGVTTALFRGSVPRHLGLSRINH